MSITDRLHAESRSKIYGTTIDTEYLAIQMEKQLKAQQDANFDCRFNSEYSSTNSENDEVNWAGTIVVIVGIPIILLICWVFSNFK